MDIIIDGWLVNKILPEARFMKAVASLHRKRRLWFVLKQVGEFQNHFVLEYFTDQSCRKLKGKIDLDQCQQVDAGIPSDSGKRDDYIFALHTSKRVYHLSAKSEYDMNRWVTSICSVCGFKPQNNDSQEKHSTSTNRFESFISSSSQASSLSDSPYIPIFECYSGIPNDNNENKCISDFKDVPKTSNIGSLSSLPTIEFYDYPKPLLKSPNDMTKSFPTDTKINSLYSQALYSNIDSPRTPFQNDVFLYDNVRPFSNENIALEPSYLNIPHLSKENEIKTNVENSEVPSVIQDNSSSPPPRPPKPYNLSDKRRSSNALSSDINSCPNVIPNNTITSQITLPSPLNIQDDSTEEEVSPLIQVPPTPSNVTDSVYDFPRFQSDDANINDKTQRKRHAYSNAPPGIFSTKETIFNYEYHPALFTNENSPSFETRKNSEPSPTFFNNYANVPTSSPISLGGFFSDTPPVVHRDLKPKRKESFGDTGLPKVLNLAPPPQGRNKTITKSTVSSSSLSEDEECSFSQRKNSIEDDSFKIIKSEIQYLDLNLDSDGSIQSPKTPEKPPTTVYKTVDFVKTKAFNVMRQNAEAYRKSQD